MSTVGILFFGSIIISYFVGMWAGMKIETKVIRWVEGLDREIDFAKLKFEEILSWRRLKVVKAASDGQLEEMGYFI